MKRSLYIMAGLLVLGASGSVRAETRSARSYFNDGASHYIKGEKEPALAAVIEGLATYTNDPELASLKILIERQQPPQQQPQQKPQDQQDQEEEKQDQQQNQDSQQQDARDRQQEEEQKMGEQGDADQPREEPPQGQAQDRPAEEMTTEEARQLLDALKQQEQSAREQIRVIMGRPVPVEKDW
jgi:hypothetical protein